MDDASRGSKKRQPLG
ncbi:hypothetical protein YPPY66_0785, partial [Yersinia pestis PY-66]